jgi:hypothetical protein
MQYFYDADGRVVRKLRDTIDDDPSGAEVGVVLKDPADVPDPSPPAPAEKHAATLVYDPDTDTFSYEYRRSRAEFARNLDPEIKAELRQYRDFIQQAPNEPVTRRQLGQVLKTVYRLVTDGDDFEQS